MRFHTSFLSSFASVTTLPTEGLPEVALIGRSNVGKSSLVNALTERKQLAKTSSTPGKTRLANIYRVEREAVRAYLIDLPGYGYARGGSGGFDALAQAVFAAPLASLLLVDARHPGLDSDADAWRSKYRSPPSPAGAPRTAIRRPQ